MRINQSIARRAGRGCLIALLALLTLGVTTAQAEWPLSLRSQLDGDTLADHFGTSLANAGDMNNDGYPDLLVGAPSGTNEMMWPPEWVGPGFVRIYSGQTWEVLYEKTGGTIGDEFGFSVAGGSDIDGDGMDFTPDFVIGAPGAALSSLDSAGAVYVYSGQDGSLIFQKEGTSAYDRFGHAVAIASEGYGPEPGRVVVGAPWADAATFMDNGVVYIYSPWDPWGVDYQLSGSDNGDHFGWSIGNLGYIGSGQYGIVVGAPDADPSGKSNAGVVYGYNASTGSQIFQIDGEATGDRFGWAVSSAGDVNLDGKPDVLIGAPLASPNGLTNAGCAYVYSSADATLIYRIEGTRAGAQLGYSVAAAGDVDGDSWPDLLVGSTFPSGPTTPALVYSGRDGSPLAWLSRNSIAPYAVAGGLRLNNDNLNDIAVGYPWGCGPCPQWQEMDYMNAGNVYLFQSGYQELIESITDVGNDQGKQVRLQWWSWPGNDDFVEQFAVYRRVADGLKTAVDDPFNLTATPPGTWDFVTAIPARGDTSYSVVVSTLADSTESDGTVWSVFFISALGADPTDHFDSPPDSGYSVDNLAPEPPPSLQAAPSGDDIALDWGPVSDLDFDFYWVYRDVTADFMLEESKRIGAVSDTAFLDESVPATTLYYKVTAVDFAGNEGDPSNEVEVAVSSCACDCHADPQCDGYTDVLDVVYGVNVAFRGAPDVLDPNVNCPWTTTDVNCSGYTDVIDVVRLVNVAFRGGDPNVEFTDPCP